MIHMDQLQTLTDLSQGNCINCVFWETNGNTMQIADRAGGDGECRRWPPVTEPGKPEACWPWTGWIEWCGEFRQATSLVVESRIEKEKE